MVIVGPLGDGLEVVVVAEFGEGLAPVVADGEYIIAGGVVGEGGDVGKQVVAAALLEFGEEVAGPVGVVDLEESLKMAVGGVLARAWSMGSPTLSRWVWTAARS